MFSKFPRKLELETTYLVANSRLLRFEDRAVEGRTIVPLIEIFFIVGIGWNECRDLKSSHLDSIRWQRKRC